MNPHRCAWAEKDALYCDPISSQTRRAALTVVDEVFRRVTVWLAPVLAFTAEEAWLARTPSETGSVHTETLPETPAAWRDEALAKRWAKIRRVRRVVTGALEIERAAKRIGASLERKRLNDAVQLQAAQLAEWNEKLEQRVQEQLVQLDRLGRLKDFFPPQVAESIIEGGSDPSAIDRRTSTMTSPRQRRRARTWSAERVIDVTK